MIEEPPILKILGEDKRPRPSNDLVELFNGAETGHVCDAMGGSGAMDHEIKPMGATPPRLLGPALTVDCGPADILALLAALPEARPGDVLVLSTGNHLGCASIGDQVAAMAKNAGITGIVTDGMVRDINGIEHVGLPVFARGITPNSPFGKGPGSVGYPVTVAGRPVSSGDIVIGDRDGVVIVPRARAEQVAGNLEAVRSAEKELAQKVTAGLTCFENVVDLLASPATVREE